MWTALSRRARRAWPAPGWRRGCGLACGAPADAPHEGPGLAFFLANADARRLLSEPLSGRPARRLTPPQAHAYLSAESLAGDGRKVYLDVYGCQMNVNDTEVVHALLTQAGYESTSNPLEADVWLLVTCSIREGAEAKIWRKLRHIQAQKGGSYRANLKVGLLGCMAERLKEKLLEHDHLVDVVAGPDAYRDLPRLLATTTYSNEAAINVILSMEETYADVTPMRLNEDKVTGFVSIQRGCDNMCSYCIVPFTRGRERSRPVSSILNEVRILADQGVKEITLLGQNVNSYRDSAKESVALFGGLDSSDTTRSTSGFRSIYKPKMGGVRFADLLHQVAEVDPEVRIRFTSPHPKDFPDEVLHLIAETNNICSQIHLPAQCGSTRILAEMKRGYSREAYLELVDHVRDVIPNVALSSDMIVGFCGETDEEFRETLSLVERVKFHKIFNFPYSLREKTYADRKLVDDVPHEVKKARHLELDTLHRKEAEDLNRSLIGSEQIVLIEGLSRRSAEEFQGRSDGNVKVIFPNPPGSSLSVGDYCRVTIDGATSQILRGEFRVQTNLSGQSLAPNVAARSN